MTFWLFVFFWPTPFCWNVVHCNSQFQEMVQILLVLSFTVEKWINGPMVIRKQSDDELWTSRERYILFLKAGTFGDMTQAGSFWGESNLQKSFWHYILEFHRQIDSQTDLPIFSDSTVYSLFMLVLHFCLTKITTVKLFSNSTSTKMVVNSPRTSTKNGVSLHFHWNFHRNSPIQPSSHPTRRLFQVLRCLQP